MEKNNISSPWPSSSRRASEREAKQEAVLSAAAAAFSGKGYHSTSLEEIANSLGVSKPTLYYYAKNKAALLEAVCNRALHQIVSYEPDESHQGPLEQLMALLRRFAQVVATDYGRCLVLVLDTELAESPRERLRAARREINERIEQLLAEGIEAGEIAPCDVKMTAFMLAGAINWIGHWYDGSGRLPPEAIADEFAARLELGLRPRV